MTMASKPRVIDNPDERRYELWLGTTRAGLIEYRSQPGVVVLIHTEVDPALAGQGLGERLVAGTLEDLRARGRKLVPLCLPAPPPRPGRPGRWRPGRSPVTMARPPDDSRLGRASGAPEVTVLYDRGRCRHYAECVGGLPQVFDPTRRPWIRADLADPQAVAEVVRRCPTGALHYRLAADAPEAPTRPSTITRDPAGPLLVRGDLVLDTPAGPLAETRAALCACGRTQDQPFCDGTCGVNAGHPRGTRDQAEESP
jgi:uncharacterized Fe-S cluster protein YjdI/predicted GNAT family acetyltransferase/CDGSH-type Zn-finger protein